PDLAMFTGREAELATLDRLVAGRDGAGPLVVALDGMAGGGKSTLAVHFAHGVAAAFPDGQLYLDLQSHQLDGESVPPEDAVAGLLYGLGVAAADLPETLDAQGGAYRRPPAGKQLPP